MSHPQTEIGDTLSLCDLARLNRAAYSPSLAAPVLARAGLTGFAQATGLVYQEDQDATVTEVWMTDAPRAYDLAVAYRRIR